MIGLSFRHNLNQNLLGSSNTGYIVPPQQCSSSTTDKRTDVWSRPSCIYTQIFSPKKMFFSLFRGKKKGVFTFSVPKKNLKNFYKKGIMQHFSADAKVPPKAKRNPL